MSLVELCHLRLLEVGGLRAAVVAGRMLLVLLQLLVQVPKLGVRCWSFQLGIVLARSELLLKT
jgi:hypothetical protein